MTIYLENSVFIGSSDDKLRGVAWSIFFNKTKIEHILYTNATINNNKDKPMSSQNTTFCLYHKDFFSGG